MIRRQVNYLYELSIIIDKHSRIHGNLSLSGMRDIMGELEFAARGTAGIDFLFPGSVFPPWALAISTGYTFRRNNRAVGL